MAKSFQDNTRTLGGSSGSGARGGGSARVSRVSQVPRVIPKKIVTKVNGETVRTSVKKTLTGKIKLTNDTNGKTMKISKKELNSTINAMAPRKAVK